MATTTDISNTVLVIKDSSKEIVNAIVWTSMTSILSAAFRIVPKIQEVAKDIPGSRRFDVLVSVLEDALVAWGEIDAANAETVATLRVTLRDMLAPAVSAMINAVHSGDVALSVQAGIGMLATVVATASTSKFSWSCCGARAAAAAAPAQPSQHHLDEGILCRREYIR